MYSTFVTIHTMCQYKCAATDTLVPLLVLILIYWIWLETSMRKSLKAYRNGLSKEL